MEIKEFKPLPASPYQGGTKRRVLLVREKIIMKSYMQQAISLAKKGNYSTQPNPMVGCIIEKNGKIIGKGWHKGPGLPHAEIEALKEAKNLAKGANVYVNLEPCSHYGRTPPCVDALIKAQIKSVHIPFIDPNPLVKGKGIEKLKAAGIEVFIGEEAKAAKYLNEIFLHYITKKQPFVIAKWAMTLDGKIALPNGRSKWITSEKSRQHAHQLRRNTKAILVGVNTVITDDPLLTARNSSCELPKQPLRIILDSTGKTPLNAKISKPGSLIATTEHTSITWRKKMCDRGVEILVLPATQDGQVSTVDLLKELGKKEISSLLIEGGSQVLSNFWRHQLINKFYIYVAPKLIGGTFCPLSKWSLDSMENAFNLEIERRRLIGDDMLFIARSKT